MIGAVTGYAKHHTYLGTPELKQNLPKKKRSPIKIIRGRKSKPIQYIQTMNKTI